MYGTLQAHKTKSQKMLQGQIGVRFYIGIKFEYSYNCCPSILGEGPQCFICWLTELGGSTMKTKKHEKMGRGSLCLSSHSPPTPAYTHLSGTTP